LRRRDRLHTYGPLWYHGAHTVREVLVSDPGWITSGADKPPTVTLLSAAEHYGRFAIGPLPPGYGHALGNGLRRVLLSSIPGAAITRIKITDVYHEFSTIPGVREDVTELVLNVKGIRLRCYSERPVRLVLVHQDPGVVRAQDIDTPSNVELVNPDHYLCVVDDDATALEIELTVERGRGFLMADGRGSLPIGEIAVDAIFSPIPKVNYVVEPTGGYERIVIEIWTDGTTRPGDALSYAAQLMAQHAQVIAAFGQIREEEAAPAASSGIPDEVYNIPVEDLDLTTRTYNCLKRADITRVGQILEKSDRDLASVRNLGQKSIDEIWEKLGARNLGREALAIA